MDSSLLYQIQPLKKLLHEMGLSPTKDRGQNFLMDQNLLKKMAERIPQTLPVLEVGPGLGHFTRFLLNRGLSLTCVELDSGFAKFLESHLENEIQLIHGDFLKLDFETLPEPRYTVAANIPYSLSQEILLKLLRNGSRIENFYLLVQKEFAEKLCASPDSAQYNRISVLAQAFTRPTILFTLPGSAFYPAPKVESAFVEFQTQNRPYCPVFEKRITALFSARRKILSTGLKALNPALLETVPSRWLQSRVENLSPEELYEFLSVSGKTSK